MSDPRYPIGEFRYSRPPGVAQRVTLIAQIEEAPARLRAAVAGLDAAQLATPYRDGGWTLRQVVHHVPDSHMNSYVRFRLALTEEEPSIRTYDEARWAELEDAAHGPLELSLRLLDALHARWVTLLRSLSEADWKRRLRHPERGLLDLEHMLALYAWHGRHHVAQIDGLRERRGF